MMGHSTFMTVLTERFPEVARAVDQYQAGNLHCEVAVLREAAEQAMDEGRLWDAERYFRFVHEVLPDADEALRNAIEVSFIEDFAFGKYTEQRHRALTERVGKPLREKIAAINARWR